VVSGHACVSGALVTGVLRDVLHAEKLESLKAVEREPCVGNHSAEGGQEASVECAHSAFLQTKEHP